MKKVVIFVSLFFSFMSMAQEQYYLGRSPKGLLLGDAYTGRADDEFSMYYNPAILARNSGVDFTIINPRIGATNVLDELDRFENFPKKDPAAISDRIMGLPVHLHGSAFPGIKFGPFGFGMFTSTTTNMVLRNKTHPTLDIDHRYDRGMILGLGFNLNFKKKSSWSLRPKKNTTKSGNDTAFGFAVKQINRNAIQKRYDLFGSELLGKITGDGIEDPDAFKDALGYSRGKAWGFDAGFEHVTRFAFSEFSAGISLLDIGDTRFKTISGKDKVKPQEMMVRSGVAFKQDFKLFDYSLSFDFHPMNKGVDIGRMIHFGVDIGLPLLRFMVGVSEGYPSYGMGVNLWPIKIIGGFYSVELGSKFREQEGKRAFVYLNLFDFSLDI